jgi:hypothetical protein
MSRRHLRGAFLVFLGLPCAACGTADPPVPWDSTEMIQQISADLRRVERLTPAPRDLDVLAWRVVERVYEDPMPRRLPPVHSRRRSEAALLWGRLEAKDGAPEWVLIEAFRNDGEPWRRAMIFTELRAPRLALRPGETADGVWHGFNRYAKPPTSNEVCTFASISFLAAPPELRDSGLRVETSGGIRIRTWRRVIHEEPACAGWESSRPEAAAFWPARPDGLLYERFKVTRMECGSPKALSRRSPWAKADRIPLPVRDTNGWSQRVGSRRPCT